MPESDAGSDGGWQFGFMYHFFHIKALTYITFIIHL